MRSSGKKISNTNSAKLIIFSSLLAGRSGAFSHRKNWATTAAQATTKKRKPEKKRTEKIVNALIKINLGKESFHYVGRQSSIQQNESGTIHQRLADWLTICVYIQRRKDWQRDNQKERKFRFYLFINLTFIWCSQPTTSHQPSDNVQTHIGADTDYFGIFYFIFLLLFLSVLRQRKKGRWRRRRRMNRERESEWKKIWKKWVKE